jgi:hypothetical protein
MTTRAMQPSTNWRETIADDEDARFLRHAETLRRLQREAARGGPPARALHAKPNAGLEAELEVLAGLPAHAAAGLFAKPGKYRAFVRFSNGSGKSQSDRRGDVRGLAVKVVGVEGTKIIPGMESAATQDFLAIRSAATPFATVDEFIALVVAAQSPLLLLPRLGNAIGWGRAFGLLPKIARALAEPTSSLASTRYFSALPIRCGDFAVHFAFVPRDAKAPGKTGSRDGLGVQLADRLRQGAVVYDLALQFFVDAARTPIEDASIEWRESDAPFVNVARLTIAQQDVDSARGRRVAAFVESLSFDPWHALVAHRPLGNLMRARNPAYRLATIERSAAKEPTGAERFDD